MTSPQVAAADPVPLYKPDLGDDVHAAVSAALTDGWLGLGPLTQRFERELADYLELADTGRELVSTSSCTAALHLSTVLAGAGPGDEVICPAFTYVAGHQAVSATGASVVFADIEERTLGIDAEAVRPLISERTKAIMAVHYAGIPCDLDSIYSLAAEYGLRVIEDAAHAFGSRHAGRRVGAGGDLVCFSFGPVKTITSLEGGAVVTPHPDDVQRLQEMRLIGVTADTGARYERGRMWEYDVVRQGFRYHLGSVPAAVGLAQLAHVEVYIKNRQTICRTYNELLAEVPGLRTPQTDWADVSPYIYVVQLDDATRRGALMAYLKTQGIATGIHYNGAQDYSFYAGSRRGPLNVTERVSRSVVTLPLHPFMATDTVARVVGAISDFMTA